jgi:hypothetical protein
MLTKTTRIASALALALTASVATANTITVVTDGDAGALDAATLAPAATAAVATNHEYISGDEDGGTAGIVIFDVGTGEAVDKHVITYNATTSGVLNNGFLVFNFTDVALKGDAAEEYFLVRTSVGGVPVSGITDLETVGSTFAVVKDANDNLTSVTFQIEASANVGLNDVLMLANAEDDIDALNDYPSIGPVSFVVATDLTLSQTSDKDLTVSVSAQTSTTAAFAAANVSATAIISSSPALTATSFTAASSTVDLSLAGVSFLDEGADIDHASVTTNDTDLDESQARGLRLDRDIGGDYPTVLDAGDLIKIQVSTGEDCTAVDGTDVGKVAAAFAVIGGTTTVDSSTQDYAACTFTMDSNFGVAGLVADLDDGTGVNLVIDTDGTEGDIKSATWTTTLSVDLNSSGTFAEYDSATSHVWDATISGPAAIVPYIYAFNGSMSTQSLIEIANYAGVVRDVAVKVNLVSFDSNFVRTNEGSFSDYFLGTVAADAVTQFTGDDIIARLISPSADKTAADGYNVTPVTLDPTSLYHMSVEFTMVNPGDTNTDNDNWHIAIQNKSGSSRANAPIHYQNDNGAGAVLGREDF